MILVKDGGDLLAVLPDAEQRLLIIVGGDVELEEVDAAGGAGEDAGVDVQAAAHVAVGAVEGEMLLATAIVGLVSTISMARGSFRVRMFGECFVRNRILKEIVGFVSETCRH